MSLEEYQSQLADIDALLQDSPNDESLLKLQSDLRELIALTQEEVAGEDGSGSTEMAHGDVEGGNGKEGERNETAGEALPNEATNDIVSSNGANATASTTAATATATATASSTSKTKKKLSKKFEIPSHLLPLDSDTEAERKRKRRTIQKLKSKHRSEVKEYESNKKQSAWLDFSKKKKRKNKNDASIFQTVEGGGKVGVVAGTSNGSSSGSSKRQRHTF